MDKKLLKTLCGAFGPSGAEDIVRDIIINEIKDYADSYRTDRAGNLIAFKSGRKRTEKKLLLSAHMDEVGFMATHIDENGFIRFEAVGSVDKRVVSSERIVFENGTKGIVGSKSIHLKPLKERGFCPDIDKMHIDIGCISYEDTLKYVRPGDMICFSPNFGEFGDNLVVSKAIDDRFGCAVLCSIIKQELEYDTYFAFCVCEEVGCRGARGVAFSEKADLNIIVESTTAGDIHGIKQPDSACFIGGGAVISFMDGGTLYKQKLVRDIYSLAHKNEIKAQYKTAVSGGNDAMVYQNTAGSSQVIAVSLPTRYIHSASCTASFDDMTEIEKLLIKIIERGYQND